MLAPLLRAGQSDPLRDITPWGGQVFRGRKAGSDGDNFAVLIRRWNLKLYEQASRSEWLPVTSMDNEEYRRFFSARGRRLRRTN